MSAKPSGKTARPAAKPLDRDREFARLALSKKLVTREHAEECLRAAHDLARRGKALAIEEVFVRKGYLRRQEAQKIARTLPAPQPKTAKLDLAPGVGATPEYAAAGRRCPSCDKDPGRAEDYCPRCGADLETGAPGPDATSCGSCGRVVKKGSAVCPRCALPIERSRLGRRGTGGGWLDRLIVLAAVTGCFYFLVYRNVIAPRAAPGTVEGDALSPAERVRDALVKNDLDAAARALEEAIKEEGHDPALEPAYALACLRAGRKEDATAAILAARRRRPDDTDLKLVAAEIAASSGDLEGARKALALVSEREQDDAFQRTRVRVAEAANDKADLARALQSLKGPTPVETHRMSELAVERGQRLMDEKKLDDARRELEQAIQWQPKWSVAREKLGVLYLKRGENGQAAVQFQIAVDLDALDPAARLGFAIALERKKETAAALDNYRAFLRLAKDLPEFSKEIETVKARIEELEKK